MSWLVIIACVCYEVNKVGSVNSCSKLIETSWTWKETQLFTHTHTHAYIYIHVHSGQFILLINFTWDIKHSFGFSDIFRHFFFCQLVRYWMYSIGSSSSSATFLMVVLGKYNCTRARRNGDTCKMALFVTILEQWFCTFLVNLPRLYWKNQQKVGDRMSNFKLSQKLGRSTKHILMDRLGYIRALVVN